MIRYYLDLVSSDGSSTLAADHLLETPVPLAWMSELDAWDPRWNSAVMDLDEPTDLR
jgi:hypothetical protein